MMMMISLNDQRRNEGITDITVIELQYKYWAAVTSDMHV